MLDRLNPGKGARHRTKRVGRGPGSGIGRFCGRGVKGQGTRSRGRPTKLRFEGGQMPLTQRLPKRGFRPIHRKPVDILNLSDLATFDEGSSVDPQVLRDRGLVGKKAEIVKLLGDGESPAKLSVQVHRVSAAARQKIEAAGGSVELIS